MTKCVPRGLTAAERLEYDGWIIGDKGCWLWQGGYTTRRGYKTLTFRGQSCSAHRLAYETWVAPVPDGLMVRHKCDTPPCICPTHLELGDHKDNMKDKAQRLRVAGELNPNAKLSETDIKRIHTLRACGWLHREISAEFGISTGYVSLLLNGKYRRT